MKKVESTCDFSDDDAGLLFRQVTATFNCFQQGTTVHLLKNNIKPKNKTKNITFKLLSLNDNLSSLASSGNLCKYSNISLQKLITLISVYIKIYATQMQNSLIFKNKGFRAKLSGDKIYMKPRKKYRTFHLLQNIRWAAKYSDVLGSGGKFQSPSTLSSGSCVHSFQ